MSDWQPVYDDNRDGSDNGRGVESLVNHLDAAQDAAEAKRRFDYVVARLTRSQHELFLLMAAGLTREQIAAELGIDRTTLSHRETALLRRMRRLVDTLKEGNQRESKRLPTQRSHETIWG